MQALQNMYEYLLDAESQMRPEKTNNDVINYSVEGSQSVPVAAGAGDANICGGIVQLYWENILARCLDVNEHVRQSALKVRICYGITLQVCLWSSLRYKRAYSSVGRWSDPIERSIVKGNGNIEVDCWDFVNV